MAKEYSIKENDVVKWLNESEVGGDPIELGQGLHFDDDGKVALGFNQTDFSGQSNEVYIGNISEDLSTATTININDDQIKIGTHKNLGIENQVFSGITLNEDGLSIAQSSNGKAGLEFQNGNILFGKFTDPSTFGIGLSINDTFDFRVIDNINNVGLTYEQDYSSNFTDRSLVDKAYVDSKSSEPVGNATDETDVVVKFNQLLENMRSSGLLKIADPV